MTKRPILTGAELRVESLGGQNVIVQNLGTNTIYASINPNITPDADDVFEIPAGGGVNVYGANGTIYLMGTGRAQCTGTDYSTVNFKMPSSSASSGGGGEEPVGETMPHLNGLQGYFDYRDAKVDNGVWTWANKLDDDTCRIELLGDDYTKTDDSFRFGKTGFQNAYLDNGNNGPTTIYAIARNSVNDNGFLKVQCSQTRSAGLWFYMTTHGANDAWYGGQPCYSAAEFSGYDGPIRTTIYTMPDEYHIYVFSGDTQYVINNFYMDRYAYDDMYPGGTFSITNPSFQFISFGRYDKNAKPLGDVYWKFFAIGDGVQTPEQIRENIAWLARKYGVGR